MSSPNPSRKTVCGAPVWVHGLALGASGAFTALVTLLYLLYRDDDVWVRWAGQALHPDHVFAEAVRGSIFRQRANTFSNLGYVYVGFYVIAYAWWDARRTVSPKAPYAVRHPALAGFFGAACVVLGIGSGLMHAAMTPWGHRADVFGMFITMTALIALQWARRVPTLPLGARRVPVWPFLVLAAPPVSIFLVVRPELFGGGIAVMAGLIAIAAGGIVIDQILRNPVQQRRWCALAFVSLALAFYLWNLDVARRFTAPESWLQGHALWHLLTAVTLGAMAVFYRTELPVPSAEA